MYCHPSGIFHVKLHKAPLITPFSRLLCGVSVGFCAEGVLGGWRAVTFSERVALWKPNTHGEVLLARLGGVSCKQPRLWPWRSRASEPAVHSCSVIRQECFPEGPASRGREAPAARGLCPCRARGPRPHGPRRERSAVQGVPLTLGVPD